MCPAEGASFRYSYRLASHRRCAHRQAGRLYRNLSQSISINMIEIVNLVLSSLTVFGQVLVVLIVLSLVFRKPLLLNIIENNLLLFGFIVAFVATAGSLFYSEIAHFEPCKLCWFQRIAMYPQLILFGIAYLKNDIRVLPYARLLSLIGLIIAGYHYLLQRGAAPALQCSSVGYSVSCSQHFVMQFGYITIPLMAFTAFGLILLFSALSKHKN